MTIDYNKSCFFTGHRRIYKNEIPYIRQTTNKLIIELIEKYNVSDFITGGALGFDTISAIEVLALKDKYPHIRLHLYFPCIDQWIKWSDKDKHIWENIKERADSYKFITETTYITGCMQLRNHAMVHDAYFGIAYCKNNFGGTYQTIKFARDKGRNVFVIR